MRWTPTRVIALPLLALAVCVMAGCGGSHKTTTTTTSTTTATTTTAVTTSATTTTAAPPTTTSTTTPSGLGALASAANCSQLADLGTAFSQAMAGTAPTDLAARAQILQQFAAETPAAIRPDFEIVADAFAKIVGALKGVNLSSGGVPSAATIAKLEALGSSLNEPELSKAESAIAAWAASNCKS